MEGRLLFQHCAVLTGVSVAAPSRTVVIEGAKISAIAPAERVVPLPGDWVVDCRGRLLTPPLYEAEAVHAAEAVRGLRAAEALRRGASTAGTGALSPISEGAEANLVLWDLVPSRGVFVQPKHLLAAWAVVSGTVRLREGVLLGVDFLGLANRAAQALEQP